jgi:hypothetical protein
MNKKVNSYERVTASIRGDRADRVGGDSRSGFHYTASRFERLCYQGCFRRTS